MCSYVCYPLQLPGVQERGRDGHCGEVCAFHLPHGVLNHRLACRRGGALGAAGNAFTVLLALAAAAAAAWALAESLRATDGRVSEFWSIVSDARVRVRACPSHPTSPFVACCAWLAQGAALSRCGCDRLPPKQQRRMNRVERFGPAKGESGLNQSLTHAAEGHAEHRHCLTILSLSVCWLGSVQAQGARDAAAGILGQLDTLQGTLDTISRDLPGATTARPSLSPSCCQRPP